MLNYQIADLTIAINSKLPLISDMFASKFDQFLTDRRKCDVALSYTLSKSPKLEKYTEIPTNFNDWIVRHNSRLWWYSYTNPLFKYRLESFYNKLHNRGRIFVSEVILKTKIQALSLFSTDQLLVSRMLLPNNGLILHGNAVKILDKTFIIIGKSGDGKSTLSKVLSLQGATRLTDDRTVVRFVNEIPLVFGSWMHGTEEVITNTKNKIAGFIILEKNINNSIEKIDCSNIKTCALLGSIVKPLLKHSEWDTLLNTLLKFKDLPMYKLSFNINIDNNEQIALIGDL